MTGLAFVLVAAAFGLGVIRAAIGPTVADRAVGADVGLYSVIGGLTLLAVAMGTEHLVDVVLIGVLLGFLATVSLAALVGRRSS